MSTPISIPSTESLHHAFETSSKVVIISHVRPDGDAYGSCLALGLILVALGKDVQVVNEDGLTNFSTSYPVVPC